MGHYLIGIEILLKLACAAGLIVAPRTLARLLGLPSADEPFWARLLGATLFGLAAAMVVELRFAPGHGLGIGGIVAINLAAATMLGALLILGRAGTTKRGRLVLWLTALMLALLGLVGIVSGL